MFYKALFLYFIFLFSSSLFSQNKLKKYVSNSVLADPSNYWYKVKISEDGFYKVSYDDLITFGIDPSLINSNSIHIYGNASGILPEDNDQFINDDLIQNSISYFGLEDGTFDSGDYLIFYAFGPHLWNNNSGFFQRSLNIYSDYSFYFICVSNNIPKKNVQPYITNKNPTTTVSTYDYFSIHEKEDTSIVNGGQRWYGELFDNILRYSINFRLPTQAIAPVKVRYSFASNASQAGNYLSIYSNNSLLNKSFLSTVSSDYSRVQDEFEYSSSSNNLFFDIELVRNSPSIKLFFDKLEINTRCDLVFTGSQFRFRDQKSVLKNGVVKFVISSQSKMIAWDVSNRTNPKEIVLTSTLNGYEFNCETDSLKEFALCSLNSLSSPVFVSRINSQNIHGLDGAKLIIVTPSEFKDAANRLADLHRKLGETVNVIHLDQIYNEFSSGSQDPTAIKLCARMFYDRFGSGKANSISNLLLFGDGSFDPKNRVANNNNWVPTFQFLNSEDHLNAMVSDDYFGILGDNGSIYGDDSMQIGVGRLLISSNKIADEQVDKIEQYIRKGYNSDSVECCETNQSSSFGDWRTTYVLISDDEENGYFVNNDSEPHSANVALKHPELNSEKIYCDSYKQITMAGGERYPDVNIAIDEAVNNGALLVNYVGHGGEVGAAEERIITIPQINSWDNFSKMCLFVSSTCEFTKYDDPSRVSAGEWLSLNPNGGAIALMTTTRPVFFSVNTATGNSFYKNVFERDQNFKALTFGEILRRTKNMVNSDVNKHSFTLIGDPALRLALPDLKIIIDSVNGNDISKNQDTIKALSKSRIVGHLENQIGDKLKLNGEVSVRVFDKAKTNNTLGQDLKSPVIPYQTQTNILFKGRSVVSNGIFEINFITPKDIDYSFGQGKISLYFNDSLIDGLGYENRFIVGGINNTSKLDSVGPKITMYLNDEHFVSSGLTNDTPKLIVGLEDESGINTIGNGIGHDIVAVLDNDVANPIVLNNYYISNLNSYQKGRVVYDFKKLSAGRHHLTLKVWDVFNNPSESVLDFVVQNSEKMELSHVLNYPNPFSTKTHFYFEHNQICNQLDVQIQIMTISGNLVKTIQENVSLQGFRSDGIAWDGCDEYGDKLAKGVYVYRITVKNSQGEIAEIIEKLVIL